MHDKGQNADHRLLEQLTEKKPDVSITETQTEQTATQTPIAEKSAVKKDVLEDLVGRNRANNLTERNRPEQTEGHKDA